MIHFSNHIEQHMTKHPYFSPTSTLVSEALEFMRRGGFRHLPVVEKGKVVGVVSDRTLKEASEFANSMHLKLGDVMITEPYCVELGTPLSETLHTMLERKIGSAIVLDFEGSVAGIFTSFDAMQILATVLDRASDDIKFEPNMEQFLSGNLFV